MLVAVAGSFLLGGSPSRSAQPSVPAALAGLDRRVVQVGEDRLDVVVAADHARGLMGIADLGPIDGMLFAYDRDVDPLDHRFWMQDVLIPLDVAFFAADGSLVSQVSMPLCPDADQAARSCPLYPAGGPFRWALETPSGAVRVAAGSRLTFPDGAP